MGKVTYVTCAFCGRRVPRDKAVPLYKRPSWLPPNVDVQYMGLATEKIYVCISCAKHRGISFADWRKKVNRSDQAHRERARRAAMGKRHVRHRRSHRRTDNAEQGSGEKQQ